MKLIVDVEKDYYEIIKYNVEHGQKYKPWEIIANGIPYEERPQGEWIPVSERLPDVSQRYLVYTKYDEVMTDFFMGDEFMQGDDVIAWMPLPEGYKKGGKEE